jgi:hypothetical protein
MELKPGRPQEKTSDDTRIFRPTLDELGLSYDQSSRYQTIASLSTPAFETHLARTKAAGMELTPAGVSRDM